MSLSQTVKRTARLVRLARALAPLGADRRARAVIVAMALLVPIKRRLPWLRDWLVTLRIRKFGCCARFSVSDRSDLLLLEEVFAQDSYALPDGYEPRTILDLGANIGDTAVYFAMRYPEAKVYAFEPAPAVFETLKRNVRQFPNVSVYQLALGGADERIQLHIAPESFKSSTVKPGHGAVSVPVRSTTIDSITRELRIEHVDVIKIDIEGAEFSALAGFSRLREVGCVIGEAHFDLMEASREQFYALFNGFELRVQHQEIPAMPEADYDGFIARRHPP